MTKEIDDCFKDARKLQDKAIKYELNAIIIALGLCPSIKSFKLGYDECDNDEGGSYRTYYITSINSYPTQIRSDNIDYELESEGLWTENIQKILFESKTKEEQFADEITLLCETIEKLSNQVTNYLCSRNEVDIGILSKEMSQLNSSF